VDLGVGGEDGERVADVGRENVGDGVAEMASTSGLKRLPSQMGHGTKTSERNCISTRSLPRPWQLSQRPSPLLKEKLEALKPASCAAGTVA